MRRPASGTHRHAGADAVFQHALHRGQTRTAAQQHHRTITSYVEYEVAVRRVNEQSIPIFHMIVQVVGDESRRSERRVRRCGFALDADPVVRARITAFVLM